MPGPAAGPAAVREDGEPRAAPYESGPFRCSTEVEHRNGPPEKSINTYEGFGLSIHFSQ